MAKHAMAIALLMAATICMAHAAEVKPAAAAAAAPAAAADAALPAGVIDLRKSTFEEAAHEDAREHAVQQEAARLGEGMYDAADGFVFTGVVVPSNFTPEGHGYCYPHALEAANMTFARIGCPAGYSLTKAGQCVARALVPVHSCYQGPECIAPYNETAEGAACFTPEVRELNLGLLALAKAGAVTPEIAPAIETVEAATAEQPMDMPRASIAAGAAASGAKVDFGERTLPLVDLAARLAVIDWPAARVAALRPLVHEAVKKLPANATEEVAPLMPECLRTCCETEVAVSKQVASPAIKCAEEGAALDLVSLHCVPAGRKAGELFEACPAGMRTCELAGWRRPVCAGQEKVDGADACEALASLAAAHQLPKLGCPKAAAAAAAAATKA